MSALLVDPVYFRVVSYAVIQCKLFGIPTTLGSSLCVVDLDTKFLEDPTSDPLIMGMRAGTRKYFWRDIFWNDTSLYCTDIIQKAEGFINKIHGTKHDTPASYRDAQIHIANWHKLITLLAAYSTLDKAIKILYKTKL